MAGGVIIAERRNPVISASHRGPDPNISTVRAVSFSREHLARRDRGGPPEPSVPEELMMGAMPAAKKDTNWRQELAEKRIAPTQADTQFELVSEFEPKGDQPTAIAELTSGLLRGDKHQVLLGVTGSGKTFTLANLIARRRPARAVISPTTRRSRPSSTGVQGVLPGERGRVLRLLLRLLPAGSLHPAVGHLHREGRAGERRDRPHAPRRPRELFERRDVVVVASVSCIYGIG